MMARRLKLQDVPGDTFQSCFEWTLIQVEHREVDKYSLKMRVYRLLRTSAVTFLAKQALTSPLSDSPDLESISIHVQSNRTV